MANSIPRIVPPAYFLASTLAMILLHVFVPGGYWLHAPWRYIGVVPLVLGLALGVGAGNLFRKAGTPLRPGEHANVLVTSGAFKRTRNPMYVGLVVTLIGVAALLGSFSPLIVIPIFVWIIQTQFIRKEERWMEEWFGESYVEYKKNTPRWLF